jgi:hypothetical protein
MTPTFHAIAMETTKPLAQRRLVDPLGVAKRLGEFHFFDVSGVTALAHDLGNKFADQKPIGRLAFLPAAHTALDFGDYYGSGKRTGFLIDQDGDTARCRAVVTTADDRRVISPYHFDIGLNETADNTVSLVWRDATQAAVACVAAPLIYGALALINTPRTIGRRQHMPHAGLQRKLAAAHGMPGKYPLHAWTTIILEVRPPRIEGERVHEARLTGSKCLHFCRAHLRIRNGALEYVSPSWKGNGALGIKQSRYDVRLPRAA